MYVRGSHSMDSISNRIQTNPESNQAFPNILGFNESLLVNAKAAPIRTETPAKIMAEFQPWLSISAPQIGVPVRPENPKIPIPIPR